MLQLERTIRSRQLRIQFCCQRLAKTVKTIAGFLLGAQQ